MSEQVFALDQALERVDNDKEFLCDLVGMFFDELPTYMEKLEESITVQSPRQLEETAHAMKSALGNLGANSASRIALALEKDGKASILENARRLVDELTTEIQKFQNAFNEYADS